MTRGCFCGPPLGISYIMFILRRIQLTLIAAYEIMWACYWYASQLRTYAAPLDGAA